MHDTLINTSDSRFCSEGDYLSPEPEVKATYLRETGAHPRTSRMGQGTQVLNKTVRFAGFPFGLHFSRFPPHLPPTRPTPGSGRSPCAAPLHLCCSQCSPCALGI